MIIRLIRWIFTNVIGVTTVSGENRADDRTPLADSAAVLWEEARRQVSSQVDEVDVLRNRSVAILSIASLVAGLFGGRIVTTHHHPAYVTAAIAGALVCFGLSVIAIIVVLAPRKKKWKFSENLSSYFDDLNRGDLRPLDVTGMLAQHSEVSRQANQTVLDGIYPWFTVACVLVGIQVVAWGVAIL